MHSIKNVFSGISIALLFSACSYSGPIKSGDLVLEVGDNMDITLTTGLADTPIVRPATSFSEILVDGAELEYVKTSSSRKSVNDNFGKGTLYIIEGEFEFIVNGEKYLCKSGDSLHFPKNMTHGCKCIKKGKLLDTFTPQREDFL